MEPMGFRRGMNDLLDTGLDVEVMATDRSTSIQKIMREEFPHVQHEFDIWHTAKGMFFRNPCKHTCYYPHSGPTAIETYLAPLNGDNIEIVGV